MQKDGGAAAAAAAAPTGCFKCGRPGHWSRDCAFSSSSAKPIPASSKPPFARPAGRPLSAAAVTKKAARTRPKLTPDLLLSDDGLGYILRHFPRAFKYHGRGHEVTDLGNLIGLYAEWHSRLIPYYSFDQFVRKVEQVGTAKRARRCISELKERIAKDGDPTKLHEPPVEPVASDGEQVNEGEDQMDQAANVVKTQVECNVIDEIREEILMEVYSEMYSEATEEPSQANNESDQSNATSAQDSEQPPVEAEPSQAAITIANGHEKIQITEEQRARMEVNRLKALERAAQRASSSQVT